MSSKHCSGCGRDLGEGVSFCASCGAPVKGTEAAQLHRELGGLVSANRVSPGVFPEVWRFTTTEGNQFLTADEGQAFDLKSVGTVIQGATPCTIVIKDCVRGWLWHKQAFLPLLASPDYINNFDASRVYKRKTGWNDAIERLNADRVLEHMILGIPSGTISTTGRTYTYVRDDPKNPFTCKGQLVPYGNLTLAALIWMPRGEMGLVDMVPHPKGPYHGIDRGVTALRRIASVISALPEQGPAYGPAIGWNIIPHLRAMAPPPPASTGLSPTDTIEVGRQPKFRPEG